MLLAGVDVDGVVDASDVVCDVVVVVVCWTGTG